MKKYVFITPAIGNMGGSQMYTYNKSKYLEKQGWDVFVFYTCYYEDIMIAYFSKYKELFIPEIMYGIQYVPKWKRKTILNKIHDIVGSSDEIVIESHLLCYAEWAELIAKDLNAKHIVNFLEEHIPVFKNKEYSFLEYKLYRWEFMSSSEKGLRKVFKHHFIPEYLKYSNKVNFICNNVVADVKSNFRLGDCDFYIISIGRLDKPYIDDMLSEIITFCQDNNEYTYGLIMIGGSNNGLQEVQIPLLFKDITNIKLYMLGYVYPIPYDIIKQSDVAIGCANAVLVTSDIGIPTISIDINDHMAMGIYGVTTQNKHSRTDEPKTKISTLLKETLINNKYTKHIDIEYSAINSQDDVEFGKQLKYLDKSKNNNGYYDVDSIHGPINRIWSNIKWYVHEYIQRRVL